MPTVPRLSSPDVNPATGPADLGQMTARAAPENFGASNAPIVDAASKLFEQAKNNADQVAVLDADKQMSALETKLLYDPQVGALNKKGKDAFGAVEKTNTDFQSAMDQVEQGLSNDVQKEAFREKYRARQEAVNRQLNQHVAGQISEYDTDQTKAFIQNEQNNAVANPYDQTNIQTRLGSIRDAIYQHGVRNGLPEEAIKASITQATSQTNSQVLNQMLAKGDDISAQQYFEQHKETFFGQDLTHATAMIEQASSVGKAMRMADDGLQRGLTYSQMMTEGKSLTNPKERQAYESRVSELNSQRKASEQDFRERASINAINFIDQGGNWQDYSTKFASTWAQLPENERNSIMKYKAGGPPETDWGKYYDLKTLAALKPQEFSEMNLTKTFPYLAAAQRKEFIDMQTDTRKGQKPKGLDGFMADSAIVNANLGDMGFSKQDISDPTNKRVYAYRKAVDDQIIGFEERQGRKPNNNELRKIADDLAVQVAVGRKWFGLADDKKYTYQIEDDEKPNFQASDIPRKDRAQIDAVLKGMGKAQTDDNALELYVRKINKNTGKKFSAN